jgi:hypothetical protein
MKLISKENMTRTVAQQRKQDKLLKNCYGCGKKLKTTDGFYILIALSGNEESWQYPICLEDANLILTALRNRRVKT